MDMTTPAQKDRPPAQGGSGSCGQSRHVILAQSSKTLHAGLDVHEQTPSRPASPIPCGLTGREPDDHMNLRILAPGGLVLGLPARSVLASSPGMVEGPPGCTWESKAVKIDSKQKPAIHLELVKLHGSCVYRPYPAGKPCQELLAEPKKSGSAPKVGDSVEVLVGETHATLDLPTCTRTPIRP